MTTIYRRTTCFCYSLAIEIPPTNFVAEAAGTSVTFAWTTPTVSQTIVSYRLVCHPQSEIDIEIKNINTITLYDLPPVTNLSCTLAAASSGGYGPETPAINVVTDGELFKFQKVGRLLPFPCFFRCRGSRFVLLVPSNGHPCQF